MTTLALVIAIILFILGIIGTILPVLPGVVLVYAGFLVYGFMTGFETLTIYFFIVEALVLALTLVVDYVSSAVSTKKFGGSKQAAWGAIIGAVFGVIVFGPLGIIIGPFAGATAAELLWGTNLKQAIRSGWGSIIGVIGGTAFKIFAEIIMIVYFFISY